MLPLAVGVVGLALLSRRRLPARTRRRGRPPTYSDASVLLVAVLGRLWQLSTREVCDWLDRWPALAAACGLAAGRVIHPAHLSRRVRQLGPYPCWLLYLALVWRAIRGGLLTGRDVVLDSTLLPAWTPRDPDAAWSSPTPEGRVFGYKVHVLLDRAARLPIRPPPPPWRVGSPSPERNERSAMRRAPRWSAQAHTAGTPCTVCPHGTGSRLRRQRGETPMSP